MPAPVKITKEIILRASMDTLREYGNEGLNARNIASVLGCSTQPIYSTFKNMEELKLELLNKVKIVQKEKISSYLGATQSDYKAYGMGFVKFAKEERELFKFLYMQEKNPKFAGEQDVVYDEVVSVMQKEYQMSKETATAFHQNMSIFTYGLAVMQSLGRNIADEDVSFLLTEEFRALYSIYCNKDIK